MPHNKHHWYDGWFYDTFIAPHQDRMFRQIRELLPPHASVLDVGCGTGRLAFLLTDTCPAILGIDLSQRNIALAQRRLSRSSHRAVAFEHRSVLDLRTGGHTHFDVAIMTYVLHEVPPEERIPLLQDIAAIAGTVIIGDYRVPVPGGYGSYVNDAVERFAGSDHYRNFRSYVARGGLRGEVAAAELTLLEEFTGTSPTSHLVAVQGNSGGNGIMPFP